VLQETSTGEPIMQTFIDRYIEQDRPAGEAALLLCLTDDKLGPPSDAFRQRMRRPTRTPCCAGPSGS
jgi:hypothetical protein